MTVPAAYVAIGHGKRTLPLFTTSTYNPGPAPAISGPAEEPSAGPRGKLRFPLFFYNMFSLLRQGHWWVRAPAIRDSRDPPML